MARYLVRRILQAIVTLVGVVTIVFFVVRLSGDPAALLVPVDADDETYERIKAELGLNAPIHEQYLDFITDAARGEFGRSIRQQTSALGLVLDRLPATLQLALVSFAVGIGLAFALGLITQLTRSERLKEGLLWFALMRQAIPVFWFGLLLIFVFTVKLGWLPSIGKTSWKHFILPSLTLGTYQIALYLRLFNSAFEEQREEDYVRTAFAKGQSRARVILRHMLPNALLPIVTIAGINLGVLLSGTVITESVFSWPGVGRLIVQSVHQRDYPVIQAGILVVASIFVLVNLLVDLLYGVIDPRVRLR